MIVAKNLRQIVDGLIHIGAPWADMTNNQGLKHVNLFLAMNDHNNFAINGQAALILILIMMVSSTVALTVVQRSIGEIELSSTEEQSSKALQAAEAGVEQGLQTLISGQTINLQGANYQVEVGSVGTDGFVTDEDVTVNNVMEVSLLNSASVPTSVDIYWSDTADGQESPSAALEIIKYQKFAANDYRIVNFSYDPDAARRENNNFAAPTSNPAPVLNVSFAAMVSIPIAAEDQTVRVKPVYNRARLAIIPQPAGAQLPDLQRKITSVGQTESGIVRKIEVTRNQPSLPQYFDFSLYSGASLSQN